MDIPRMIAEIKDSECFNCRFGKLITALEEIAFTQPGGKPKRRVTAAKTVSVASIHNSGKDRLESASQNTEAILNYLKTHPDSKSKDIADELALKHYRMKYELRRLAKLGLVKFNGRTSLCRWSLSQSANSTVQSEIPSQASEEKKYQCPYCAKAFRNLLNMHQHKELHHPGKT